MRRYFDLLAHVEHRACRAFRKRAIADALADCVDHAGGQLLEGHLLDVVQEFGAVHPPFLPTCRAVSARFGVNFRDVKSLWKNLSALERFIDGRTLIAFDFDGTLAPIVMKPGAARMRVSTERLLREVASSIPVAVISGRSYRDLRVRVRGLHAVLIGNHGMDWGQDTAESRAFKRQTHEWLKSLRVSLRDVEGVELENKMFSLSVHYRKCLRPDSTRASVLRAIRELDGVRVVGGKRVFNLVPEGAMDKGDALFTLCERKRYDRAVYIGDDLTDEDVFRLRMPRRIFSVRVGSGGKSAATYFIDSQREMERLLRVVLSFTRAE